MGMTGSVIPAMIAAVMVASSAAGSGSRPGFFHVREESGRYWLAKPSGERFYCMAVNVVKPGDWSPKEGSPMYRGAEVRGGFERWVKFTASRLRSWGFNTVGSWSHREMEKQGIPYCATLHISPWDPNRLIDVWAPEYEAHLNAEAVKQIGDRSPLDPDLVGYFVGNELPWYGDFGWPSGGKGLLEKYMELPAGAPGRAVAERHSAERADEFLGLVAERFMEVAVAAVRRVDRNHMILGCRIAGGAPDPVIRAIGSRSDVFSMNWYVKNGRPDPRYLDRIYLLAGKPVMITEFSYRATENRGNLGNSRGADVTVPTQAERAKRYRQYVESLAVLPQVVGFHWFMYFDQPTLGRFDGEDCNYGIVDHDDEPYEPLLAAMKDLNVRAAELHAASVLPLPESGNEPRPRLKLPVAGAGESFAGMDCDLSSAEIWGDRDGGFRAEFTGGGTGGRLVYSAGTGWGGGVSFRRPAGSLDLSGAVRAVLVLRATSGARFRFVVNEDGVGPPDSGSFEGIGGADGEQYASRVLSGTGKRERYVVELCDLEKTGSFGNPSGNDVLDAPGVGYFEISLPGGQGEGEIDLESVRFE